MSKNSKGVFAALLKLILQSRYHDTPSSMVLDLPHSEVGSVFVCSSLLQEPSVYYELVNVKVQLGMPLFKLIIGSRMNVVMLVPQSYLQQGIIINPGCCHIAILNKEI